MVLLGRRCTAYLLVDEGRTVVTHHIPYQHSKVSEDGIKYARIVSTVWAFIELTRETNVTQAGSHRGHAYAAPCMGQVDLCDTITVPHVWSHKREPTLLIKQIARIA
jgi:hypothetical protein